jgi:hypothetical protein
MTNNTHQTQRPVLHMHMSEFWSGDLGLTLVTISLAVLIFVITPLREAGIPGRFMFDLVVVTLMVSGALTIKQSHLAKSFAIAVVLVCVAVLATGRLHPTPFLHELGSFLVVATLLLYVRIVLLVMFRGGPITCIYFSFGTLTTVGSSITPLHPFARSLTIAEAIVGQLFPATLIGALVAMAMESRNKP